MYMKTVILLRNLLYWITWLIYWIFINKNIMGLQQTNTEIGYFGYIWIKLIN